MKAAVAELESHAASLPGVGGVLGLASHLSAIHHLSYGRRPEAWRVPSTPFDLHRMLYRFDLFRGSHRRRQVVDDALTGTVVTVFLIWGTWDNFHNAWARGDSLRMFSVARIGAGVDLSELTVRDVVVDGWVESLARKLPQTTRYAKQQLNVWRDLAWHQTVGHARDAYLLHAGMGRQHFFDFPRPHLVAARFNQIFLPIDDEQERVLIEIAEVARV